MRKIFLFIALALLAVTAEAQGRYYYDSSRKYGLFSNWTIGVAGQYSNQAGKSNIGINALATKRIGDFWRLRYSATISGLKGNGFDRYGTAMAGISLDFVQWAYAFADAGAVVNPSSKGWLGLGVTADAGLGLNLDLGQYSQLYAEFGTNPYQYNLLWGNTYFCRLGCAVRPGITGTDRKDIDIAFHNAEQLGELKQENALLKTDLKRKQEENDTLMATLNKASSLFAILEKKLDDCNAQVAQATSAPQVASPIFQIFFEYASSEISPIEEAKVAQLAEYINTTQGNYRIEGYSSPDGDPYRNEVLSGDRARAVYWLLISYGVDKDRIIPMQNGISTQYGENSPLNRMVLVSANKY